MSLRIWLPLTKDLRQQGLDNIIVTNNGATFNSEGKLGGCYSFGTGNSYIIIDSTPLKTFTEFSFACWVKIISWNTSYSTIFAAKKSTGVSWDNLIFSLLRNFSNSTLCFNISNGSSYTSTNCQTDRLSLNTWYHIVCTYKSGEIKLYQDGNIVNTYNTNIVPNFNSIINLWLGKSNESSYQSNNLLNDVRIYDHCLSPMEVKELAKGLVLHYPLNRQGWGQENLIANTDFNGVSKKFTVTSGTEGGFTFTPTETITANTQYTVSCRLRGNANMNLYKLCTGGNESISWVNRSQLSTTEYRYFSIIFTYPSNKTLNQIYICTRYGTANTRVGDWFEIEPSSLKLEKGSIATPWCPNSSDELATTMGLNSTIEYDCSGFCNNGTRTGTFTWTSDTPKYSVSTTFNGSNCILSESPTIEGATLAAWVKVPSIVNGAYFIDYKSGLGFGTWSNYLIPSCNAAIKTTYRNTNFIVNEWNHIVVVKRDNTTVELYINGVLQPRYSTTDSWTTGVIDKLSLASRPNGTNLTSCQLCDFRIYATALSADDVKSLYQNCATIDPDGTIRGQIRN